MPSKCLVCKSPYVTITTINGGERHHFECSRCGNYVASDTFVKEYIDIDPEDIEGLQSLIKQQNAAGEEWAKVTKAEFTADHGTSEGPFSKL